MTKQLTVTDLNNLAKTILTEIDKRNFATKKDLENYATKKDLQKFVTRDDLKKALSLCATKNDLQESVDAIIAGVNGILKDIPKKSEVVLKSELKSIFG